MKKNIFILGILCSITLGAQGTDFHKLCQTFYQKAYLCGGNINVVGYSFDKDTVIDSKEYIKVASPLDFSPMFIREEGQRIYLRPQHQQEEFVLFDFALNVGDTVPYLFYYYDSSYNQWRYKYRTKDDYVYIDEGIPTDTVASISEISLQNGEKRRMYRTGQKQTFVEGIGTLSKGMFGTISRSEDPCATEYGLICCSYNEDPLYTLSESEFRAVGLQGDECRCFDMPVIDALQQVETKALLLSPNPVHDYLELQGVEAVSEVQVYDLSGQCVLRTDAVRIDVTALPAGIYLLRAVDRNNKQYQSKFVKE